MINWDKCVQSIWLVWLLSEIITHRHISSNIMHEMAAHKRSLCTHCTRKIGLVSAPRGGGGWMKVHIWSLACLCMRCSPHHGSNFTPNLARNEDFVRHHAIMSTCHHVSISKCKLVSISECQHVDETKFWLLAGWYFSMSSGQHANVAACGSVNLSPCRYGNIASCQHVTNISIELCQHNNMPASYQCGIKSACYHFSMAICQHNTISVSYQYSIKLAT